MSDVLVLAAFVAGHRSLREAALDTFVVAKPSMHVAEQCVSPALSGTFSTPIAAPR